MEGTEKNENEVLIGFRVFPDILSISTPSSP
jgi:hypothetical protein